MAADFATRAGAIGGLPPADRSSSSLFDPSQFTLAGQLDPVIPLMPAAPPASVDPSLFSSPSAGVAPNPYSFVGMPNDPTFSASLVGASTADLNSFLFEHKGFF
jgi:hypothetical protein